MKWHYTSHPCLLSLNWRSMWRMDVKKRTLSAWSSIQLVSAMRSPWALTVSPKSLNFENTWNDIFKEWDIRKCISIPAVFRILSTSSLPSRDLIADSIESVVMVRNPTSIKSMFISQSELQGPTLRWKYLDPRMWQEHARLFYGRCTPQPSHYHCVWGYHSGWDSSCRFVSAPGGSLTTDQTFILDCPGMNKVMGGTVNISDAFESYGVYIEQ